MQSKRQQTPVIWEDQVTNKFHVVNNTNGEKVPCNQFGLPLLPFRPGISGEATTKERLRATRTTGAMAWEKSLEQPAKPRPPPIDPSLRKERASTTGRFGAKTSGEIDLYEADKRSRLIKYPEIEEARLEEVEKAKVKIDELHKNYYALQSSQKAAEAGPAKEVEQKKEMRLNRSKQHAYAFTGLYRP